MRLLFDAAEIDRPSTPVDHKAAAMPAGCSETKPLFFLSLLMNLSANLSVLFRQKGKSFGPYASCVVASAGIIMLFH
jgi:hypothetical protein